VNSSKADEHSNARGVGMANNSMVSSFGINAFGLNPANFDHHYELNQPNLKLNKAPAHSRWDFTVMSVGGSYGSDVSLDFYNNYLKYLSINRQTFTGLFTNFASVLNFRYNVLPTDNSQVNYAFELKWFAANFTTPHSGAFNFTISDQVGLNTLAYSRDQEMPLNYSFTPHSDGSYDLLNVVINQSEATAWWLRKYTLGYSKEFNFSKKSGIRSLSVGAAVALVNGFGNVMLYNSQLQVNSYGVKNVNGVNHVDSLTGKQDFYSYSALTDFFQDYRDGAQAHYNFLPKPAGVGYGIDLGIAMQIGYAWRAALSVTDIGQITWNYNTIIDIDTRPFAYYNFSLVSTDPTYNAFVNHLDGLDVRKVNVNYSTNMPTKYRAGIMYNPSHAFLAELDCVKGDNNLPGNSTAYIVGMGLEYYPYPYLPVRTGITVGGPGDYYIALGTGLKIKHLTIDFALNGINQIFQSKRLSISFSTIYTI